MRRSIVLDLVLLIVFLISLVPTFTSVAVHEWLGIVVFLALVAHCVARSAYGKGVGKIVKARLVLNIMILLAVVIVLVSGVMVSGAVLPVLGLYANGYYFWDPMHAISAKVLLALLLVHVALNATVVIRISRQSGVQSDG